MPSSMKRIPTSATVALLLGKLRGMVTLGTEPSADITCAPGSVHHIILRRLLLVSQIAEVHSTGGHETSGLGNESFDLRKEFGE